MSRIKNRNNQIFKSLVYSLTYSEIPENLTRLQAVVHKQHTEKFDVSVVEFMITLDTNLVNETNALGETPIFESVKLNNVPVTEILIKYGANILHRRFDTLTCVHIAIKLDKLDVFLTLTNSNLDFTKLSSEKSDDLLDFVAKNKLYNECFNYISKNIEKFVDLTTVVIPINKKIPSQ